MASADVPMPDGGSAAGFDFTGLPSPCYVIDEAALTRNLEVLQTVQERAGCRILLALKGYAAWSTFPLLRRYLAGTTASSVAEARLGHEEFGGELHVYAPAYSDDDLAELLPLADHITFNSFAQWRRFRDPVRRSGRDIRCGLRINPQHSEVSTALYDPCCRYSRLGVVEAEFEPDELDGISGLHVHALCGCDAAALSRMLVVVEQRFGRYLKDMQWVNLGGGHHITRADYGVDRLISLVQGFRRRHGVQMYLEPGEAVALHAGVLVATVLDVTRNELELAVLDTSAAAHMPDVLEMPYRPDIVGADLPGKLPFTYRLTGNTCLAGDVIGDYSFAAPLEVGTRLVFTDMAHYSMVKNTTFNGIRLPAIAVGNSLTGDLRVVRRFGYPDYRDRLS